MSKTTWNDIQVERVNPLIERQVLHTECFTLSRLVLAKGALVALHHHRSEQITTIVSGRLQFFLDGREVIVETGDMLPIPPNIPHQVIALEDTVAVDYFAPPREDWIRGDDAYLRG